MYANMFGESINELKLKKMRGYENVKFAGEELQNLGICSTLTAFEHGGIFFRATPAVSPSS
jgi:hypothetical protein